MRTWIARALIAAAVLSFLRWWPVPDQPAAKKPVRSVPRPDADMLRAPWWRNTLTPRGPNHPSPVP